MPKLKLLTKLDNNPYTRRRIFAQESDTSGFLPNTIAVNKRGLAICAGETDLGVGYSWTTVSAFGASYSYRLSEFSLSLYRSRGSQGRAPSWDGDRIKVVIIYPPAAQMIERVNLEDYNAVVRALDIQQSKRCK